MLGLTQLLSSTRIFKSSSEKSEISSHEDEDYDIKETSRSADDVTTYPKQRRASTIYSSFLNINIPADDEEVLDDQQYDIISTQTEMITNLVVYNEYDPNKSLSDSNSYTTIPMSLDHKNKKDAELRFWSGEVVLPHSFAKVDKILGHEVTCSVDRVSLGTFYLTNYRILFQSINRRRIISIPITALQSVERESISAVNNTISIKTKDFRLVNFTFDNKENDYNLVIKFLYKSMEVDHIENLFAFDFRRNERKDAPLNWSFDTWRQYDPVSEYTRLGMNQNGWEIRDINKSYDFCSTYPQYFCVPAAITNAELTKVALFRSKQRIPVGVGIYGTECVEDRKLIKLITGTNTHSNSYYIMDARPKANAIGNKVISGAGYEKDYENCQVEFLNIQNIHEMRNSFIRLANLLKISYIEDINVYWYSSLETTGWLKHIQIILSAAKYLSVMLENGNSILIHCSDGWDRTSQLLSLCQLLLDPYYRTLKGFIVLLEKDWLSFGHRFAERAFGYLETGKLNQNKKSPIFMQFIDCVWQLKKQFPMAFEFSEEFLICVLDSFHDSKFGNFLYNCEKERVKNGVYMRTESLWQHVLAHKKDFIDLFYKEKNEKLLPKTGSHAIHFWNQYYRRRDLKAAHEVEIMQMFRELAVRNSELEQSLRNIKKKQLDTLLDSPQVTGNVCVDTKQNLE